MDELVRIAARPDGTLAVGRTLPGRGAWLCASTAATECFARARSRRAFGRALRVTVADGALDDLQRDLEGRIA